MHKIILFIIATVVLISCESSSREDVKIISKSKMEEVLYDYHIVQAMVSNLLPEERYKAEMYMNTVFEKNEISKEEFDSSMTYYNRHAKDLKDIYDNLHEKFTAINEKIQLQTGSNEMMTFSENGDTTNIWGGKQMYVLRHNDLNNKELFKINADTSFYNGDKFILKVNTRMINSDRSNKDYRFTMCLVAKYKDGKQISEFQYVTNSSAKQLTINTDKNKELDYINGFFYYSGIPDERNFAIIENIELIKIHTNKKNVTLEIKPINDGDKIISDANTSHIRKIESIKEFDTKCVEDNQKIEFETKKIVK